MRAVGLHADVVVATSRIWQTTCTLVRGPGAGAASAGSPAGEAFVIDSPVLPDELELLPVLAEQAGFRVVGLLCTHADWDHVLARYGFPDAPLGATASSVPRLADGSAQRALREFDDRWYVARRGPLTVPAPQALPVPGRCSIGEAELELYPAGGHTSDGMAIWVPWARVLVCGDYLSPVEIPMISDGGARGEYLATLDRLEPLVGRADWVVPGHGAPLAGPRAATILREDRAYVAALPDAPLPRARRSAEQKRIHADNVARL